ncbi:MAG: hypothetical protein ACRC80_04745, partial [Waterburya sp.]
SDMIANDETLSNAALNWDLSPQAIREVIEYCETHQELLIQEAEEERRYLEERGVALEPKTINR